jgi:hypothetical protein
VGLVAGVVAARYVAFSRGELIVAVAVLVGLAAVGRRFTTRRVAGAALLAALFFGGALAAVAHRRGRGRSWTRRRARW